MVMVMGMGLLGLGVEGGGSVVCLLDSLGSLVREGKPVRSE